MSGLSLNSQTTIAFKNLFNKSNTDVTKGLGNEAEDIKFNIHSDTIFVDTISSTPSTAVAAGAAVFVQADLTLDGSSNGHGFFATWPVTPPTGTDPETALPYAYGFGLLSGIAAGQRVKNAISFQYGSGYEVIPYSGTPVLANRIFVNDPRNWVYQYQSGVFFQENIGSLPQVIEVYVYTGQILTDVLGVSSGFWKLVGGNIVTDASSILSPAVPNVLPAFDDLQDLGSDANRWKDLYLGSKIDFSSVLDFAIGGSPFDNIARLDTAGLTMYAGKIITAESGNILGLIATGADVSITSVGANLNLFTQNVGIIVSDSLERFLLITGISMFIPTYSALATSGTDEVASVESASLGLVGASFRSRNYKFYDDSSPATFADVLIYAPSAGTIEVDANSLSFKGIPSGYTGSMEVKQQAGVQTTNATITTIATISTNTDEMIVIKGTVAGFVDATSPAFASAYGSTFFGVFRNTGGVLTQVSTTDLSEKYDFGGTPTTTLDISTTNVLIRVTGVAATTINWITTYEYTKLQTNS